MSGSQVPLRVVTHAQRVCSLYRRALKNQFDWSIDRVQYREKAVLMRQRFEETRSEKDPRKLAAMLEAGEDELLLNEHPNPFRYKLDPGGILYERHLDTPDSVLDFWHPWEKACYIDYFETREKRKAEFHDYYNNVILKKGIVNLSEQEYPAPRK